MTKIKKGGYRKIEFGELVRENPECAVFDLREAWLSDGSATKAARRLGISRRSFFRFVASLRVAGFAIDVPSERDFQKSYGSDHFVP